jgi:hypothetical protein
MRDTDSSRGTVTAGSDNMEDKESREQKTGRNSGQQQVDSDSRQQQ